MRLSITYDVTDPARAGEFWAAMLGRGTVHVGNTVILPGDVTQVGLRFAPTDSPVVGRDRLHLHVTSDATPQDETVARAMELGADHLDVGQLPEEPHVVLADPVGNEFCVIPAGNSYLAGCGLLGEIACDGTRGVGLFWSSALGWPLVWDRDEETAVQSPAGGTKVAWGGPPVAPKRGRNRQRFHLEVPAAEVPGTISRLQGLGATGLRKLALGEVELIDPDGNEFELSGTA